MDSILKRQIIFIANNVVVPTKLKLAKQNFFRKLICQFEIPKMASEANVSFGSGCLKYSSVATVASS